MVDAESKRKLLRAYYACMERRDLISSRLGNIGRAIADQDTLKETYEQCFGLYMEEAQLAIDINKLLLTIESTSADLRKKNIQNLEPK